MCAIDGENSSAGATWQNWARPVRRETAFSLIGNVVRPAARVQKFSVSAF